MDLHAPTMALILWITTIIAASVMTVVWRINRQERGPALWAASGVTLLVAFGFFPFWFEEDLSGAVILLNNLGAAVACLLLLEGILRFKRLGNERRRLPWYGLYLAGFAGLLYLTLEHHQLRYLVLDLNLIGLLLLTGFVLVWRNGEGLERVIYIGTSVVFLVMAGALSCRWGLAAAGWIGPEDRVNAASTLIILASIPWTLGWTYGLAMAANLRAQRNVEHIAQHDPLTGLPNRRVLTDAMERMAQRYSQGPQGSDDGFGVVILDVDGFKAINDRYGHTFGDEALVKLANSLLRVLRPEDKVVRLGGDEFILLLHGLADRRSLQQLCDRVVEAIDHPVEVKGHHVRFSASIGAAFCPEDAVDPHELLVLADQRMYANKYQRRSGSEVVCEAPLESEIPGAPQRV